MVLLPDTGRNYLSKLYSDGWMRQYGFLEGPEVVTVEHVLSAKGAEQPQMITVRPHDKVRQAIDVLQASSISQAPVVREESADVTQFVGSIRDRELLERVFRDPDALQADVAEVMAPPIPFVEWDQPIETAFDQLEHAPAVLDRQGRPGARRADPQRPARFHRPPSPGPAVGGSRAVARSLGIDVGVGKGLDVVLLDERLVPLHVSSRVHVPDVPHLIGDLRPDVIAIDSPPRWAASGRSRLTERELAALNISSFNTPSEAHGVGNRFFAWMEVGFEVFAQAAAAGFPAYSAGSPRGKALEVFPHATAVVLAGCLAPKGTRKHAWRSAVLRAQGVRTDELVIARSRRRSARRTHRASTRSRASASRPAIRAKGVIVVPCGFAARPRRTAEAPPCRAMPSRCSPTAPAAIAACDQLVRGEFAPGHDAKRKAMLWARAREGRRGARRAAARGWKKPPEMR